MMQELPIVGRKEELAQLFQVASKVETEGIQLVLISGLAGSGKTYLMQHFLSRCSHQHFEGRGWDNRASVPFHALSEAYKQLIKQAPQKLEDPSLQTAIDLLNQVLIEDTDRKKTSPPISDFCRAMNHVFMSWSDDPLILFLDDLQWVDDGTFDWMDVTFCQARNMPLVIIGAYRQEDKTVLEQLLSNREVWIKEGRVQEIELGPLTEEETARLCSLTLRENKLDEGLHKEIWVKSGGIPLYVAEELHAINHRLPMQKCGQALIRQRIDALASDETEILSIAAIIGEQFDVAPIEVVVKRDPLELSSLLLRLSNNSGIIRRNDKGYRFNHSRFREALLELVSPDVKRVIHQRLAGQVAQRSIDRTYHLVKAGGGEEAVRALVDEGNRALWHNDWRDALRFFHNAQSVLDEIETQATRTLVYQSLGDVHLLFTHEPWLAKGYYDAAMQWVSSPGEKLRLMCRIAQAIKLTNPTYYLTCLEEARAFSESYPNSDGESWFAFLELRYCFSYGYMDRGEVLLNRLQMQRGELPSDYRAELNAYRWYFAGMRGQINVLDDEKKKYESKSNHDRESIQAIRQLGGAYQFAGQVTQSIELETKAIELSQQLGLHISPLETYLSLGRAYLLIGQIQQARHYILKVEEEEKNIRSISHIYRVLAQTCYFDSTEEGVVWVRKFIKYYFDSDMIAPTRSREGVQNLLHHIGVIERVFRSASLEEEFRASMNQLEQGLRQNGHIIGTMLYLDSKVTLPTAKIAKPKELKRWDWIPGHEQAVYKITGEGVTLEGEALRGFRNMDMPRLMCEVRGDFIIQTTIRSAQDILNEHVRCNQHAARGVKVDRLLGGGGLLVMKNQRDGLRLFAHIREPGEAICTVREGENDRLLGRGLLEDDDASINLRIERHGHTIRAYVSNNQTVWHMCGEVELSDWDSVKVGIFSECPVELYSSTKLTECVFHDIYFETQTKVSRKQEPRKIKAYPRPKLDYVSPIPGMVVVSKAMRSVMDKAKEIARQGKPVLIEGETGTGKELIANALHQFGERANGPFIELNCAAVPDQLLERELFGHVRGAFTSANIDKGGLFEAANDGNLFLDEIGDASLDFQVALLRVLEKHTIRRVGDQKDRRLNVGVVAATNKDLSKAITAKTFRQDLYFRLTSARLVLPPLRKRLDDIPALTYMSLDRFCSESNKGEMEFSEAAMQVLISHSWPGNVRELIAVVENAARAANTAMITPQDLEIQFIDTVASNSVLNRENQRQRILEVLKDTYGNKSEAARRLGIGRKTLYRRMERLGLPL